LHEQAVPDQGKKGPNRACERKKRREKRAYRFVEGPRLQQRSVKREATMPARKNMSVVTRNPIADEIARCCRCPPSRALERRQDLARFGWARRLEESGGEEKKEFVIPVSPVWAGLELAIKRHGLHLWRSPTQIGAHYMDCTNNVKVFGKWPQFTPFL
jgi:hypothetical protein